ncbi:transcription-repair coupling factor [Luteolibacter ambystomatis]|uniref:Transcription-repair-coupling factor n=1 Tax=Luteolibacter ambystomatis TaxID=2824561 RepID=A0A975PGP6_9BACT|nr:transcription-repair coupling factor [Luteolibacter ambystomatis]QUE52944.1 transcription-repair coupling factor [Luteolibacter ambystomatis]
MTRAADSSHAWLRRAVTQPDFAQRLAPLATGDGEVLLDHAGDAAHAWLAAVVTEAARDRKKQRVWLVCDLPRQRERLATELELWGIVALVLPESPTETAEGTIADPEGAAEWFAVLEHLAREKAFIVICGSDAFDSPAPSPGALRDSRTILKPGTQLDPRELSETLASHGYERVPTVAGRGQFAIRGGIVDLFAWQAARPLRLEFFDTELESLREFDLDSQASTRKLDQSDLLLAEPPAAAKISDYRHKDDLIVAIGATGTYRPDVRILEDVADLEGEEDFTTACYNSPLGVFDAGDFVLEQSRREGFFKQLNEWQRDGWDVGIVFSNDGEQERFADLAGKDLQRDLGLTPLRGELLAGFTVPALKLAVLSSSELFGRYRTPGVARRSSLDRARVAIARATIDEISEGDLVVHYEYGIGRFRGIHPGDDGEELAIEYDGGSILSVPLEQAHLVGKYVGLGGKTPDLNKLGSVAWKNARKSAEKSILDYAAQLLRVHAERESNPGFAHAADSRWMFEFENSFHYTETVDQRRAIEESKKDMESPRPMDRLICGDVGFGKTEVAIRAAFKAVTGGKQVAILVPTTVLAEQHWRTFRERMSDYPVRVDLLNRFRTPSQVKDTLRGLEEGSVDIVIGTHRLVSGDVHFKDLGLVVVDEEQRFGVKHKEKFKELFRQVDVMTLSATPIPRTLYMALMGARDMSTIETPPPNRVPVSTTVCAYDERVIRDAIQREMKRGGQVFFLHNRVKTIELMASKIRQLVPEARILIGHGQMEKDDLEVVMHTFVKGEADVLLATTIIETGIDIPNANTILIDRADRFGLADLYQLRGRVGRAGEKAYAILLLPREMMTTGDARKRIHAIKQYTALGSGFKIAMRDLEIRGAGNLLGTKQSGHIAQIGFDLYCQLLRQSVDRLKGRGQTSHHAETAFKADCVCFSESAYAREDHQAVIPAFLPASWLPETKLRLAAYRELAEAVSEKAVRKLESAWRDRFGRFPEAVANLLQIARIKALAAARDVASVELQAQRLMLNRNGDYILLEGKRFPRLTHHLPKPKLDEAEGMLRSL